MNPNEAILVLVDEYNRMAETYDRLVTPAFDPIARATLELAAPKSNELFLDVGTGTGLLACLVAPLVVPQSVVAIDLADEALAVASYRAGNAGLRNIRFELMDARNIVYRSGLFDAVVSNLGLPGLGYERALHEAHRLLRPGGRFVFSTWHSQLSEGFAAYQEVLERHATPSPSKLLAQVREARTLARTDPAARTLNEPPAVQSKLRAAGFAEMRVVSRSFPAAFADVRDFLAFEAAWGWNERELGEMSPEARAAFEAELTERLGSGPGKSGFVDRWSIHFHHARSE